MIKISKVYLKPLWVVPNEDTEVAIIDKMRLEGLSFSTGMIIHTYCIS